MAFICLFVFAAAAPSLPSSLEMLTLKLLPLREEARCLYTGHGTFHDGDSGLDLFVIDECIINPGDTQFLKLGFAAAMCNHEGKAVSWLVLPRSSISKTPLRLANSGKSHEPRNNKQTNKYIHIIYIYSLYSFCLLLQTDK